MAPSFEVRGLIEGFYGTPWSPAARRRVISFLASSGMNAYVYAPKDDPYHRERWREPYPTDQLDDLLALHSHCADRGVRFGFAISPGLDFVPHADGDRDALWAKLTPFVEAGVDWFVLGFDDVPLADDAGTVHGELMAWLRDRLPAGRLSLVPTDYVGTGSSPYLHELATTLPAGTDVFWTGPTVVPATITAAEARDRADSTGGFPLLIWDNYPVNDAFMDASLHLGPLRGRDPDLAGAAVGLLANPMTQPLASLVPLATVADYLADPERYEPESAWDRAIDAVAGELSAEPGALRALAGACRASALSRAVDDPVHALVGACAANGGEARSALTAMFDDASRLSEGLPDELAAEVRPWTDQATLEAVAGTAALRVLAAPEDATWSRVLAVMGMLLAWSAARRAADRTVFGPRFACYPAIVQDGAGGVRVDPDAVLVEDANAVDRLCRMALGRGDAQR